MSNKAHEILNDAGRSVVNVGHGNFVAAHRVVAILETGSLPTKRLRESATERNLLIDATAGRKMRSLLVTDAHFVIVSALAPATLQERLNGGRYLFSQAQIELEEGEFVS